jgi:hypothetical protein
VRFGGVEEHRNHLVGEVNLLDQDDAARVGGGDQEMKVLNEMNELQQFDDNWSRGAVFRKGGNGGVGTSIVE